MLCDTHCHLDMIPDPKIALLRAKEAGVGIIINVGTSIEASRKSIEIAENTDLVDVYATCGIHAQEGPKDIKKYGHPHPVILGSETTPEEKFRSTKSDSGQARMTELSGCIAELRKVAQSSDKVVGIGECGMDYFLEPTAQGPATSEEAKKPQRDLFEEQVKLSVELDLPLIIHCRNAWDETFEIVEKYKPRGLFHSWTGGVGQAEKALNLGFYISFSGIVTFKQSLRSSTSSAGLKNAGQIPEVAKMVPEDRILIETDSPFLSPVPLRGKQNEPKNVRITAQFLAELRGIPLNAFSKITTDNAKNLFRTE